MEGASPPAHPTMSVGRATMTMLGNKQGKRTGVVVDARKPKLVVHSQQDGDGDDDEPEDDDMIDHYLSTAAQPPVTQEEQQQKQQKARGHPKTPPPSILKNKSNHKNKPRFSMPGVGDDDNKIHEEVAPGKSSKYMGKVVTSKGNVDFSPGDVSRASTAFTTPGSRREAMTPKSTARSQMQGTPIQDTPQEQEEEGEDDDEEMVDSPLLHDQGGDGSEEEDDDEMEVARVSPQRTPQAQERMTKSPAVQPVTMTEDPMEQEEDDGDDDMIPPPPPEENSESDVVDQQPSVAVAATSRAEAEDDVDVDDDDDERRNDFPLDNDNFDDDDKEGSGFQVAGTPGVQSESDDDEQERIVDKKRRVKESLEARRRKEKEMESKKPISKAGARKLKATKPQQKKARFVSPQGIQAGDRIFDEIPVDRYKHSPEDKTLRRSNRARCPPLQYWKSERIIYGPNDDPEVMGLMPVPVSVLTAQPTPYKKINRQAKRPRSAREGDDDDDDESEPEEDRNPPFDSTKLRKKFEILDGETAFVWDETIDDGREMSTFTHLQVSDAC